MKLAAALYLMSKLIAWISTFAMFSLWLEVNSAADRVIQRAVRNVGAFASRCLDYFVDLMATLQGMSAFLTLTFGCLWLSR